MSRDEVLLAKSEHTGPSHWLESTPLTWTHSLSRLDVCSIACVSSTEVTSNIKAHGTLHMMTAGREREGKGIDCARAGMYEFTQAGRMETGHSSTEREPREQA